MAVSKTFDHAAYNTAESTAGRTNRSSDSVGWTCKQPTRVLNYATALTAVNGVGADTHGSVEADVARGAAAVTP